MTDELKNEENAPKSLTAEEILQIERNQNTLEILSKDGMFRKEKIARKDLEIKLLESQVEVLKLLKEKQQRQLTDHDDKVRAKTKAAKEFVDSLKVKYGVDEQDNLVYDDETFEIDLGED